MGRKPRTLVERRDEQRAREAAAWEPPAWLCPEAREVFEDVALELARAGHALPSDRPLAAQYAQSLALVQEHLVRLRAMPPDDPDFQRVTTAVAKLATTALAMRRALGLNTKELRGKAQPVELSEGNGLDDIFGRLMDPELSEPGR